jgi:hypothetical protein
VLHEVEIAAVGHGKHIARQDVTSAGEFAAFDANGRLIAILMADASGRLRPHRNFACAF